jgi:hypothetical protein
LLAATLPFHLIKKYKHENKFTNIWGTWGRQREHYLRTIDNLLGTSSPKTFCPQYGKNQALPIAC